jgi:O-antigen ligase
MEDLKSHITFPSFVFVGLCAVVALAPLPLGAARPLAWDCLALIVALLLLASVIFLPASASDFIRESLIGPVILFGVVIAFALLQAMPWMPPILWNPVWDQAADTLTTSVSGSIIVDRTAGFIYILRLLTYAGIFYLALLTGRDTARAHIAIQLVSVSGCVYAFYGLAVYWSGNKSILWFRKWAYGGDLTATFVNRNSFATYLGLCLLAALCLLLQSFSQIKLHGDWQKKIVAAVEFTSARIGKLIVLFVLVTALLLTHSRGGLLATLSGMAALMLAITMTPSLMRLRRIGAWGMVPFIVFGIALFISGSSTFDRMMSADFDSIQRFAVYRLTLQAIGDFPIFGIGLGSFAEVFPIYRTSTISTYFDLAHNDYLQNILELGIPVAVCLFAAVIYLAGMCLHGIRTRQRDAIYPCLAVAATVLVGLHATVDFSLQIPAVTVTYMFLLGIGVAQTYSSRASIIKKSSDAVSTFSGKPDNAPDQKSEQA